jgi:DNA-directed RNA polymerase specialized sigma24 family protein
VRRWPFWTRQRCARQREAVETVAGSVPASDSGPAPPGDEDVARTFATLTSRDRALLWLAYIEEESHEDIAASLGVGRGSIKVLLFRARHRLRELLKAKGIIARASS